MLKASEELYPCIGFTVIVMIFLYSALYTNYVHIFGHSSCTELIFIIPTRAVFGKRKPAAAHRRSIHHNTIQIIMMGRTWKLKRKKCLSLQECLSPLKQRTVIMNSTFRDSVYIADACQRGATLMINVFP